MKRVHVALNPPRRAHEYVVFAKAIAARLAEDPLFSPPPALLAKLTSDIVALEAALVTVLSRRAGAATERKARQSELHGTLQALKAYVQSVANTRTAEEAAVVAARAGMDVKDTKGPKRVPLVVKPGRTSGSVHAYMKAAKTRAGYEWQLRVEGDDWTSLPLTTRADTELHGLVPGTVAWVRARAVTAEGPSAWLAPVRVVVE